MALSLGGRIRQDPQIRSCTFSCPFSFFAGNAGSHGRGSVAPPASPTALAMSVVAAAAAKRKAGDPGGMPVIKQVKREASDEEREAEVEERVETAGGEVATIVAAEETVKEETVATTATLQTDGQQIYIIQVRVNPSDPSQKRRESV